MLSGASQLARQALMDRFVSSSELPLKVWRPLQPNTKEILKRVSSFLITCVETLNKCLLQFYRTRGCSVLLDIPEAFMFPSEGALGDPGTSSKRVF